MSFLTTNISSINNYVSETKKNYLLKSFLGHFQPFSCSFPGPVLSRALSTFRDVSFSWISVVWSLEFHFCLFCVSTSDRGRSMISWTTKRQTWNAILEWSNLDVQSFEDDLYDSLSVNGDVFGDGSLLRWVTVIAHFLAVSVLPTLVKVLGYQQPSAFRKQVRSFTLFFSFRLTFIQEKSSNLFCSHRCWQIFLPAAGWSGGVEKILASIRRRLLSKIHFGPPWPPLPSHPKRSFTNDPYCSYLNARRERG